VRKEEVSPSCTPLFLPLRSDFAAFDEKNGTAGRDDADTLDNWCDFSSGNIPQALLADRGSFGPAAAIRIRSALRNKGREIACRDMHSGFKPF
jgi:hypothetical protein